MSQDLQPLYLLPNIAFLDICVYKMATYLSRRNLFLTFARTSDRQKPFKLIKGGTLSSLLGTNFSTHFTSCHPPGVKKRFIKSEALSSLLGTDFSRTISEENKRLDLQTKTTRNLSIHPPGWKKKGFIKGEALSSLLRTNYQGQYLKKT